eukprot:UN05224
MDCKICCKRIFLTFDHVKVLKWMARVVLLILNHQIVIIMIVIMIIVLKICYQINKIVIISIICCQ